MSDTTWSIDNVIVSNFSHFIIFGCSLFAIGWGGVNTLKVRTINKHDNQASSPSGFNYVASLMTHSINYKLECLTLSCVGAQGRA